LGHVFPLRVNGAVGLHGCADAFGDIITTVIVVVIGALCRVSPVASFGFRDRRGLGSAPCPVRHRVTGSTFLL
jgi:hypothetical protein